MPAKFSATVPATAAPFLHSPRYSDYIPARMPEFPIFPVNVHVIAIIVAQNINCRVSLIAQIFAAPLRHPVRTGNSLSVAILCQYRLTHIWPGQIIFKHLIHNPRNALEIISSIYKLVIVSPGRSNCEIVTLASVPLRIYTV